MDKITIVFSKRTKMSDLIDAEYKLLLLLEKLDIKLGFGDKSVETVCNEIGFDPDCFIFLANLHARKPMPNIQELFNKLPLPPFLGYLNGAHHYFLEKRLPNIRRKLGKIFADEEKEIRTLVLNFFDNYMNEVGEHMVYEDKVVFPYIRTLLGEEIDKNYSIDIFQKRHNDIEEKMDDLKQILLKYVSPIKNQDIVTNVLMDLYMCQEDLQVHTFVEEELIIPRVRGIERD